MLNICAFLTKTQPDSHGNAPLKVSSFTASNPPETEGFGRFAPPAGIDVNKLDEEEEEEEEEEFISEENNEFISSAELRRNRISSKG